MTAKAPRPDVVDDLRQARDELERIENLIEQERVNGRTALDSPARDRHAYLSAQLETAHAHMVGTGVAEHALRDTLGRPRVRDAWRRGEADRLFGDLLRHYAYHRRAFPQTVDFVVDWIRQFGRPERPQPQPEAER